MIESLMEPADTINLVQGTDEWRHVRMGKVTASGITDAMGKPNSTGRKNYIAALVAERMTAIPNGSFQSWSMREGKESEPLARIAYEFYFDAEVREVGFIGHPTILMAGCSPDGLVGTDGLVEIKCPNTATHIETLLKGKIDRTYVLQMQFQMACTGRAWCDWLSFDPRMPGDLQLYRYRIDRDDKLIAELEEAANQLLGDVDKTCIALRPIARKRQAPEPEPEPESPPEEGSDASDDGVGDGDGSVTAADETATAAVPVTAALDAVLVGPSAETSPAYGTEQDLDRSIVLGVDRSEWSDDDWRNAREHWIEMAGNALGGAALDNIIKVTAGLRADMIERGRDMSAKKIETAVATRRKELEREEA